jgi:mRNA interferase RelE/StbE
VSWDYEFDTRAVKELKKLGAQAQQQIISYLDSRIAGRGDDPRRFGKPLTGDLKGLWRYRVNDYRLICSIEEERLIVLVLRVGHRRDVYD